MATTLRPVRPLALLAAASLFAACASHGGTRPAWSGPDSDSYPHSTGTAGSGARPPLPRQDDPEALVHPPLKVEVGAVIGKQSMELNFGLGQGSESGGTSAVLGRLDAQYYFRNGFGLYLAGNFVSGAEVFEDVQAGRFPESDFDTNDIGLGLAFRATVDDDFRMPVRAGIYRQKSSFKSGPFLQEVTPFDVLSVEQETETVGLRLGVEPEFILLQRIEGGPRTELSVFADLSTGAGPTDMDLVSENQTQAVSLAQSDNSYSFIMTWEFGVRFSISALTVGLSGFGKKVSTASGEGGIGLGTDEDFTGVGLSAGVRF